MMESLKGHIKSFLAGHPFFKKWLFGAIKIFAVISGLLVAVFVIGYLFFLTIFGIGYLLGMPDGVLVVMWAVAAIVAVIAGCVSFVDNIDFL